MSVVKWRETTLVNTTIQDVQAEPDVAVLENGNYVIVYENHGNNGFGYQLFDPTGQSIGNEFIVTGIGGDELRTPHVTARPDGGFSVVVRRLDSPTDDDITIYHYDETGTQVAIESQAESSLANTSTVDITHNNSGLNVAAVWSNLDSTSGDIILQRTDAVTGQRFGAEIDVNTTTTGAQRDPTVTTLENGNLAVAWFDDQLNQIRTRVIDSGTGAGVTVNDNFINGVGVTLSSDPHVTALKNGGYVITWRESSNTFPDFDSGIVFRVVNEQGVAFGNPVNVTTADGSQVDPAVVALPNGTFAIVYVDTDGDDHIMGQLYSSLGVVIGNPFQVTHEQVSSVSKIAADALPDGRFVVTWEDSVSSEDPFSFGVFQQIMDPRDGNVVGTDTNDQLFGGPGSDQIVGKDGDDTLVGGDGADSIFGGNNNDTIFGENGGDYIDAGSGNDVVFGDSNTQPELPPGTGNDVILGGAGQDTLVGEGGDDYVDGGSGQEIFMSGGDGTDTISFLSATSGVNIGLWQASNQINDDGFGNVENITGFEWIVGSNFSDGLLGDGFDNAIQGMDGGDAIYGGLGNDFLVGGEGADFLQGDDGFDAFAFDASDFQTGVFDTISDFSESVTSFDSLYLTGLTLGDITTVDFGGDVYVYTNVALDQGIVVENFTAAQLADQIIFA